MKYLSQHCYIRNSDLISPPPHGIAYEKTQKADSTNMTAQTTDVKAEKEKRNFGQWLWSEIKFFLGLLTFVLAMLTLIWGHFKIPSESMLPTLEVGDHIYVSKFAYGYSKHSLPFMLHKLPIPDGQIFSRLPKRGDVVVFRNPISGIIMIKRAIGLPGDTVQVTGGILLLNGEIVGRTQVDNFKFREHKGRVVEIKKYSEKLPGEKDSHFIYEKTDQGALDNTEVYTVPEGDVFFMGDNRDNSTDSRVLSETGFIPQDHLIGRADLMMFSFHRCKTEEGLRCPGVRFGKKL